MEAGRYLDALVGERVMKWSPTPKPPKSKSPPDELPAYSTDIAAAWAVVAVLGWAAFTLCKSGSKWACKRGHETLGTGSTAPLAICLAALRATKQ